MASYKNKIRMAFLRSLSAKQPLSHLNGAGVFCFIKVLWAELCYPQVHVVGLECKIAHAILEGN